MRYDIYNLLYDYFKGCDCPNYYIEDILKTNYSDYPIENGKYSRFK